MEQISYGTASCGHTGQIFKTGKCAHCYIAELESDVKRLLCIDSGRELQRLYKIEEIALKFRDAFRYDPGHSDLDREQPIHITVTLGQWRDLNCALRHNSHSKC